MWTQSQSLSYIIAHATQTASNLRRDTDINRRIAGNAPMNQRENGRSRQPAFSSCQR